MFTFDRAPTKHTREKLFAILHDGYKETQEIMCEFLPDEVITYKCVPAASPGYKRVLDHLQQLRRNGHLTLEDGAWKRVL